jgi:hypothetical protein
MNNAQISGGAQTDVIIKTDPASTVNLTFLYAFQLSLNIKLQVEAGYSFPSARTATDAMTATAEIRSDSAAPTLIRLMSCSPEELSLPWDSAPPSDGQKAL